MSNNNIYTCKACGGFNIISQKLTCDVWGDYTNKSVDFINCQSCDFNFAPNNFHDFSKTKNFTEGANTPDQSSRVGSAENPGREYHMAKMAIDILNKNNKPTKSILIYGTGLSLDHIHLSNELPEINVSITDLENFQNSDKYIAITTHDKFDIVIACEVIEHFTELRSSFNNLLSKLNDDGILICSTNISDGTSLSKTSYPFIHGHTAYYSGNSLVKILKSINAAICVDFRTPTGSLTTLGKNKRYVLIYRKPSISQAISLYFSSHFMAPCEPCRKTLNPKKWPHRLLQYIRVLFSRQ